MGRDKALLEVGGRTLLQRTVDLLAGTGAQRVLISGRTGLDGSIPDLMPAAGPVGGLYATLDFIHREAGLDGTPLLAAPVDMPLLNEESLTRLLQAPCEAKAARYRDEIFPCLIRADGALFNYLRDVFAGAEQEKGMSMHALLDHLQAVEVSREGLPEEVFYNINRPDDWETIRSLL